MGSLRRSSLNLFLISLWSIHQLILTFQGLKAKKKKKWSPSSHFSLHSSLIPGFPPWSPQLLAPLISVHTPTALNDNECYSRHTACTRTCTLLFLHSILTLGHLGLRSSKTQRVVSVWSSSGDVALCGHVVTRRPSIIEGKRWIGMMSWLDCGAPLNGNAEREMHGSIKILCLAR